jgi:hypothetical protein
MVNAIKTGADEFKISLTREELLIVCRCITETRSELPDWEFPIRVGAQTGEADAMSQMLIEAAGEPLPDNA